MAKTKKKDEIDALPDGAPASGLSTNVQRPATEVDKQFDIQPDTDMVNHPPHYTAHPSGVECIEITEHMNFCLGNALKYIWRAELKGHDVEDLKKAVFYLDREIKRRQK